MVFRHLSRPQALLLLPVLALALAAPVRAQESADEADDTEAPAANLAGKGSIGFSLGAMRYLGGDLGDGANVRPMLKGVFRYVWNGRLATALEVGYGWNAYGEGGNYEGPDSVGTLAVVVPVTLGLDYQFSNSSPTVMPRAGAGLGLYSMQIRSGRDNESRDPVSDQLREKAGFGLYGKLGCEFLLKPSLSLHADGFYHYMFIGDEEKYPSGWFDANGSFAEIRVGLNYYFTIRQTGAAPRGPSDEEEEE